MFCFKCGKEISENDTKCPHCGSEIKNPANAGVQNKVPTISTSAVKYSVNCKECRGSHEHLFTLKELVLLFGGAVLFVIGLFALITLPIAIGMIYFGIKSVNDEPCPSCGKTPNQIKTAMLEQRRFGLLRAENNTNFYKTLYTYDKRYKLRLVSAVLAVIFCVLTVVPYFSPVTVEVSMFGFSSGEQAIDLFLGVIAEYQEGGLFFVLIITLVLAVFFAFFGLSYKDSLSLIWKYGHIVFSAIVIIAAITVNPDIGFDSIETNIGALKFWIIFLQLLSIAFAVFNRLFSKAKWLNERINTEGEN